MPETPKSGSLQQLSARENLQSSTMRALKLEINLAS